MARDGLVWTRQVFEQRQQGIEHDGDGAEADFEQRSTGDEDYVVLV